MGIFSSSETLGTVTTTLGPTGWTFKTDLPPRLLSIAFFHYLERVIHSSGADKGADFLVGISNQLQQHLGQTESSGAIAERGSAAELLDGANPLPVAIDNRDWRFGFTYHRKKEKDSPDGYFHYTSFEVRPRLGDFDLMCRVGHTSAALVYKQAYKAGDKHIRLFLFRTLTLALLMYRPDGFGFPKMTTLGKVPNIAPYMFFGYPMVEGVTAQMAAQFMSAYLQGKDIPQEFWGQ